VIATNKYGPAEIVTDGVDGLLFPPGDEIALAEKILRLHDDKDLYARLAAAARQKYLDNYQMDQIKSKVEGILQTQIDGAENEIAKSMRLI
jgi:glycosyltransferase involved in cell wall biosynthesis